MSQCSIEELSSLKDGFKGEDEDGGEGEDGGLRSGGILEKNFVDPERKNGRTTCWEARRSGSDRLKE